jgi:DNA polymerase-3 subunit alpha
VARHYKFACGCEYPVIEDETPEGVVPLLDFRTEDMPESCPAVWDMLARGQTVGVFQLDSSFAKQWCRRLRPESLEHMGALGAILRPGPLQAVDADGVSMTEHYCRRKNGEEEVVSYHPVVDRALAKTYNLVVFQEGIMSLAKEVAGFDMAGVERVRKGVAKKLQSVLAELGREFVDGAEKLGLVPAGVAREVWSWIQAAGRYAFCRAHAISYGVTGYDTAYLKAHFPLAFYTARLRGAHNKPDPKGEISRLVHDARLFDVRVVTPDLRFPHERFDTDRRVVRFGLADVKGVGFATVQKLLASLKEAEGELGKGVGEFSWPELLFVLSPKVPAGAFSRLIEAGAMDWTGVARRRMLEEHKSLRALQDSELKFVLARQETTLPERLGALALPRCRKPKRKSDPEPPGPFGGCRSDAREAAVASLKALLDRPPSPLVDDPPWVISREEELLGVGLTYHRVDTCDIALANCTCKEFLSGRVGNLVMVVDVLDLREVKTKKGKSAGQKMAFARVSDASCAMDVTLFPEAYKEYAHLFVVGNTVVIQGDVSPGKKKLDGFVVERASQATPAS